MVSQAEGGVRPQRVEVLRETTTGTIETNPSWGLFSDNLRDLSWSPTPGLNEQRGIGGVDPVGVFNGPEEHEVTVLYDVQTFPVDGSGDPNGFDGDGITRDTDNDLHNTHQLLAREEQNSIPANETVDGYGDSGSESGSPTSKDTRLYLVGLGGYISSVVYTGDPGSEQPVQAEVTYSYEKVREYQIDQPSASTTLTVESTDAADTSIDVDVEDEDGNTTETITTDAADGTTATSGATSFTGIDGIEVQGDHVGDIVVTDGTEVLAIIRGSDYYGHGEDDKGVPVLGTGSHAAALGTAYETILGDTIERPSGTGYGFEVNSVEFSVENEIQSDPQVGSPRMSMKVGNRTTEVTATINGPVESVKAADAALGGDEASFRWTLDGGYLEATSAFLPEPPEVTKSEGEAAMSLDNTFVGQGLTVST